MRTQSTTTIGPCAQTCGSCLATLGFRALALIWPQGLLGRHLAAEVDKASTQVVWSSSCEFGPAPRSRVTYSVACDVRWQWNKDVDVSSQGHSQGVGETGLGWELE